MVVVVGVVVVVVGVVVLGVAAVAVVMGNMSESRYCALWVMCWILSVMLSWARRFSLWSFMLYK